MANEDFPSRPIRLVVPVPPGGGTDVIARLLADKLRAKAGQPVVIENRAGGASGSVGAEYVSRSAPDGYTLLLSAPGPLAFNKFLYRKLGYEPSDFAPISVVASIRSVLVVRADSPFKTVRDLIAQAKAQPKKLTFGSGGAGTTLHLASELFKKLSGTEIVHVPYKGDAASSLGLLQGQVDMKFGDLSTSLVHVKSGRMRILAVADEARIPQLPEVPSISETLPGFRTSLWYGLVAPMNTPAAVLGKLSGWTAEVLADPEVVARMNELSIQPRGTSPAEMAKFVQRESEQLGELIQSMKIAAD